MGPSGALRLFGGAGPRDIEAIDGHGPALAQQLPAWVIDLYGDAAKLVRDRQRADFSLIDTDVDHAVFALHKESDRFADGKVLAADGELLLVDPEAGEPLSPDGLVGAQRDPRV